MRDQEPAPPARGNAADEKVIPVRDLLDENGTARLEHGKEIYLLRITRNGKLILTK